MDKEVKFHTIEFCRRGKCCPTVTIHGEKIFIGGAEEGFTIFNKNQFLDFISAVKDGRFDFIFNELDA